MSAVDYSAHKLGWYSVQELSAIDSLLDVIASSFIYCAIAAGRKNIRELIVSLHILWLHDTVMSAVVYSAHKLGWYSVQELSVV